MAFIKLFQIRPNLSSTVKLNVFRARQFRRSDNSVSGVVPARFPSAKGPAVDSSTVGPEVLGREMAGHPVLRTELPECRLLDITQAFLSDRTSGVEPATGGRIDEARRLPGQGG